MFIKKVQEIVEKNQSNIYKKQLEMLKSVGKPQAQYTTFMQYYETFTSISMIVVITFLLLIFSNTGSQEYTSKMNLCHFVIFFVAGYGENLDIKVKADIRWRLWSWIERFLYDIHWVSV